LEAYVKRVLETETGARLLKLKKVLNERLVTLSQMGRLADVDWANEPMLMYAPHSAENSHHQFVHSFNPARVTRVLCAWPDWAGLVTTQPIASSSLSPSPHRSRGRQGAHVAEAWVCWLWPWRAVQHSMLGIVTLCLLISSLRAKRDLASSPSPPAKKLKKKSDKMYACVSA
jgi:hypothetical protein